MVKSIGIGLLGFGTVGSGVLEVLTSRSDAIATRAGAMLDVRRVLVRNASRGRAFEVPSGVLTTDPQSVLADETVGIIIELIGCGDGIEPARGFIEQAIRAGKHVVTANKQVLASRGTGLYALAARHGVSLRYEAAVGGAIPIVRVLSESLTGDRVLSISAVLNGTTNYILTRMAESGATLAEALAEAQALGYAEADPSVDVEGWDATYKLVLLARLAFGAQWPAREIRIEDVTRRGITGVTLEDVLRARADGGVLRLVASALLADGSLQLSVAPTVLPASHPLARATGSQNAIVLQTDVAGELVFYGNGAGRLPTASAVVADVIEAARQIVAAGGR